MVVFFIFKFLFIYLLWGVLGLPCGVQAFSSCNKRGLVSCGWCSGVSLLSVDSRVRGLQELRLVGSRAWPQSWHVGLVAPRHVESSCSRNWTCAPALEGGFITTRSPGKSGEYVCENVLVGAHWFIALNRQPHFAPVFTMSLVLGGFFFCCFLPVLPNGLHIESPRASREKRGSQCHPSRCHPRSLGFDWVSWTSAMHTVHTLLIQASQATKMVKML